MTQMTETESPFFMTKPEGEEVTKRERYLAAMVFASEVLDRMPEDNLSRWNQSDLLPSVPTYSDDDLTFGCWVSESFHFLYDYLKPLATEVEKGSSSVDVPFIVLTINGFRVKVTRYDLNCERIETDEMEEVEETVTVQEAVVETRTVTRPKVIKKCPSVLSDRED